MKDMFILISWEWSFRDPASMVAESVILLHNNILYYLIITSVFTGLTVARSLYLFTWNPTNAKGTFYTYYLKWLLTIRNIFVNRNISKVSEVVSSYDLTEKSDLTTEKSSYSWGNFISTKVSINIFNLLNQEKFNFFLSQTFIYYFLTSKENYISPTRWYQRNKDVKYLTIARLYEYIILEYVWAAIPTLVLVSIFIPSLTLLLGQDLDYTHKLSPIVVRVWGNQWYWTYIPSAQYFDSLFMGRFDSYMIPEDGLEFGAHRLLEVDNRLILPVNTWIEFLVTASDVLHSFAIPELAVKLDAVPGRSNSINIFITRPGVFYGQCSELCGPYHGFMPIVIEAVDAQAFKNWLISWIQNGDDVEYISNFENFYFEFLVLSYNLFEKYSINLNEYF